MEQAWAAAPCAAAHGELYNSFMALLDVVFDWWRHRREERQDSREQTRLEREGRDELRGLYADLIESAPDGELRDLARERRFRATLQIIADVESDVFHEPGRFSAAGEPPALPGGVPTSAESDAVLAAANALCELGKFDEALALVRFAEGLESQGEHQLILIAIAALEGLGRLDEAIQEVGHLLETGFPRWQALRSKVLLFVVGERFEEAMVAADAVIHEENEEAFGLALRAYVQSHQGEREAALESATDACNARPDDRNLLGLKLDMAAVVDLDYAKEVADALLAVDTADVAAHRTRAEWFFKSNDFKAAREEASEVVALEPTSSANHVLLARMLDGEGEFDASLEEFALAAELEPASSHATWHMLGPILKKPATDPDSSRDQALSVISVLSAVIEQEQTGQELRATAHLFRAVFLLLQGAREIAKVDMQKALEIGVPESVKEHFFRFADEINDT